MNNLATRLTEVMAELELKTRKSLASFCNVSEGVVSQWFAGNTQLGPKPLKAFSSKTNYSLDWLTEGKLPKYRGQSVRHHEGYQPLPAKVGLITASHPDDAALDDVVYVPESRIEFSGGDGRVAQFELIEDQEPATYRLSWFQKYGINPERVRRFRMSGESMVPMLWPRDTILVNFDETNILDGKVYAIRYDNELRVKYLSRRLDGTIVLRSVNPAYKDEEVSAELAEQHISIIGRVRDKSGTGGL